MSLNSYCDKLIKPSWVVAEEATDPLNLDPLGNYIDPNSTQTIADELQHIIDSTSTTDTTNSTDLDPDDVKQRNAERILVKRQELRRIAYVQQLIDDAKNAIRNISNMKVNLDEYNLDNAKEAIRILEGRESDVMIKLRQAIENQLQSQNQVNDYLNYVKNLL